MDAGEGRNIPQFHTTGEQDSHFYVLAFHTGFYQHTTQSVEVEAFLILNYSPSQGFTQFSFEVRSATNRLLAYHRGVDRHQELAFALIDGFYEYGMEPHRWSLYPDEQIEPVSFQDEPHSIAFFAAKKKLGSMLYCFRGVAWTKARHKVTSLIRLPIDEGMISPFDKNAENEELLRSAEQIEQQYTAGKCPSDRMPPNSQDEP